MFGGIIPALSPGTERYLYYGILALTPVFTR
jgi:hypothetical protein